MSKTSSCSHRKSFQKQTRLERFLPILINSLKIASLRFHILKFPISRSFAYKQRSLLPVDSFSIHSTISGLSLSLSRAYTKQKRNKAHMRPKRADHMMMSFCKKIPSETIEHAVLSFSRARQLFTNLHLKHQQCFVNAKR